MFIYTTALATRLKRKVFQAGAIRAMLKDLTGNILFEYGIEIRTCRFLEYGVIFELESPEPIDRKFVSRTIRCRTSGPIRNEFAELFSMPSLWTKDIYFHEGACDGTVDHEIGKYFNNIRTR